jgi:hypothetical protein
VGAAEEDVEAAVAVQVLDYERAARVRKSGLGVEPPGSGEGIPRRPLVPADLGEDVLPPVAVDVPPGETVAAAFRPEDEGDEGRLAVRALAEAKDLERGLLVVADRVELGTPSPS